MISKIDIWGFSLFQCHFHTDNRIITKEILNRLFWIAEQDSSNPSNFPPHSRSLCRLLLNWKASVKLQVHFWCICKYTISSNLMMTKFAILVTFFFFWIWSYDNVYMQVFILLSCSLAVFCNVSQYLCIGRFSATSFQVIGHMKTLCVLTLGWLLFDVEMTFKNIMGMVLAVVGMLIYSWAVEIEKKAAASKIHPFVKHNQQAGEETRLLSNEGKEQSLLKDVEFGVSRG